MDFTVDIVKDVLSIFKRKLFNFIFGQSIYSNLCPFVIPGLGIVLLCAFGCLSDAAKPYGASGKNLKTWLSSMRSKR